MNSGIACKSLYKVCRNDQSTIHLSVVYGKISLINVCNCYDKNEYGPSVYTFVSIRGMYFH